LDLLAHQLSVLEMQNAAETFGGVLVKIRP
jgi:hypothetical protein